MLSKKTKGVVRIMIASIVVLQLSSCFPTSTLELGRTVGKDKAQIGVGLGAVHSDDGLISGTNYVPSIDFKFKYGLRKNLDIGFSYTILGFLQAESKYQFYGNDTSRFALSLGLNGGTMIVPASKFEFYSLGLPLYASYHPSKNVALYAKPILLLYSESNLYKNFYTSVGLCYGLDTKFMIEYTYPYSQVSLGFVFNIDNLKNK